MASETLVVSFQSLYEVAQVLTGYGRIEDISPEGDITWTIEGKDGFELGRRVAEVEKEVNAHVGGVLFQRKETP